jgi:hypothetical protein
MTLPTDTDGLYDDDPSDPSVQLHQQFHAVLHARFNLRESNGLVQVNHGSNAAQGRPDAPYVLWVGTVTPTNAINGDFGYGW